MGGHVQGGEVVHSAGLDVSPAAEQKSNAVFEVSLDGHVQRSEAVLWFRVDLCTPVQQGLDDDGLAKPGGTVERGQSVLRRMKE